MTQVSRQLKVKGMHCQGCEQTIEAAVGCLPGVKQVQARYGRGSVDVVFDDDLIRLNGIVRVIEAKGYPLDRPEPVPLPRRLMQWSIFPILLVILGGVTLFGKSQMSLLSQLDARMSYTMVFSIGLLTGFHCIGMCGGFVVSYAVTEQPRKLGARVLAHFLYAFGKTVSYTVFGAVFGLLGAVVAITPTMRGVAALASGLFLILFGLKMLNVFSSLRGFGLRMPKLLSRTLSTGMQGRRSPLVIGLLTGFLLGCGPLQAMYVLAAGTGNPAEGAKLVFFFGLGTLPALLGFGFFANLISRGAMHQIVRASGILVIAMGLMMTNHGLKLSHSGYDLATLMARWQLSGVPKENQNGGSMPHSGH
ncbi:sulfite exporter TauE/SafE family protein [Candidatus Methylocalor cossyra]|uniref:Sulfite exporter TauE/SafE n=1 Tax=Candidatus Methylocalor cossyra TaxID=3108543 RepID=A0ABM9NHZ7_9GAMM